MTYYEARRFIPDAICKQTLTDKDVLRAVEKNGCHDGHFGLCRFGGPGGESAPRNAPRLASWKAVARGVLRSRSRFPEGDGLYLVGGEDTLSIQLRRKRVSKTDDGWIFSGAVTIVDEEEGVMTAVEFDIDSLHADSSAVVPIRAAFGRATGRRVLSTS